MDKSMDMIVDNCSANGANFIIFFVVDLLYVSTSFLWWQAVADIPGVKLSHALRSHSRRMWRHREGARHVHNNTSCRARSPSRPCGSITAVVHGCPRGRWPPQAPRHDEGPPGGLTRE